MSFLLGQLTILPFPLLKVESYKFSKPDHVEVLSKRLEYISNANSQNRETQLIEGGIFFLCFLLDKLVVDENRERTHGQVEEDEESKFLDQAQDLVRIQFMFFHFVGRVL